MLKRERKKIISTLISIAMSWFGLIYLLHEVIGETNIELIERFAGESIDKATAFRRAAEHSLLLDVRFHYAILGVIMVILGYQVYRYFTTQDSPAEVRQDEERRAKLRENMLSRRKDPFSVNRRYYVLIAAVVIFVIALLLERLL